MRLNTLDRKNLQKIATTIAQTRYDVELDGRSSNQDLIDYIEKYTPVYILRHDCFECEIKMPPKVRRVISFGKKRGRKTNSHEQ